MRGLRPILKRASLLLSAQQLLVIRILTSRSHCFDLSWKLVGLFWDQHKEQTMGQSLRVAKPSLTNGPLRGCSAFGNCSLPK